MTESNHQTHSPEAPEAPEAFDVIIVGSGPAGIAAAADFQNAGLHTVMLEKGALADAITKWPFYMRFFSTSEKVELPGFPLITTEEKPTREEYLQYLRRYVRDKQLPIRTGHTVEKVEQASSLLPPPAGNNGAERGSDNGADSGTDGGSDGESGSELSGLPLSVANGLPGLRFTVSGHDEWGEPFTFRSRYVVVATGAYEFPKMLDVPGEDLHKVSHYFTEVHHFAFKKVAVVGGRNSAAEAALLMYRAGADVTLIHRGPKMSPLKFWLEPDLNNRIKNGEIQAYFNAAITEIRPREIVVRTEGGELVTVPNDYVLAMTGYRPETALLREAGVEVDPATNRPCYNPDTLETNVPGLFVAGVIAAGDISNEIFIENSRVHGEMILRGIRVGEKRVVTAGR